MTAQLLINKLHKCSAFAHYEGYSASVDFSREARSVVSFEVERG
jgi:hypothetical protein